ncbi:phage head closure protein [Bacillus sp. DX1.1]|uniref:phage head closure protein n=1 Tax=unclassified Bacillus (in: firmicutes) TaxID=185979 RepID=UPI00256FB145|nr:MULTISPECIES: phage head closure protein [unclassified Bacillus (in: firmicutes)]MDM5155847.1 phage head closure protein [Bacillus sp. DX1.1]WJE80143.1 phage head closure protein [Bacillus sp. DX3.1]
MNDILFFPEVTTVEDDLGQIEEVETFSRQVFCEEKSIPQSEFFLAGQSGMKVSCILVVYSMDYQKEQKVKYDEISYHIYRTYKRNDEKIELYCEVKAGG